MPIRGQWLVILLLGLLQQAPTRPTEEQNFRISGTVLDALSGLPLTRTEVSIAATNGMGMTASVFTGANGRFLFEHLKPGKYVLSARCRGYGQQNFQQHENYTTAVAVGMALGSEGLVFRLLPGASIGGQAKDEFSDPVRGAQVMLFREGMGNGRRSIHLQRQVTTDDEGRYRFGGLQPGRYYLAVSAHPWYAQHRTMPLEQQVTELGSGTIGLGRIVEQNTSLDVVYPVTYYSGATDSARASAITLQPGERATADFTLQPVPAFHLRLKAPGMDLAQGGGVRVMQSILNDYQTYLPGQTTATGKDSIEVGGIPPGHVIIGLDAPNGKERPSWRQDVEASRDTELNLTESAGGTVISGIVKAAGTTSLPQQAAVGIYDRETGTTFYAGISADGKFEFQNAALKPGKYDLSITNAPGFYVDQVQAVGAKVSGRSFELGTTEPVRLAVEISQGLGRVEGVALREGKPAAGAMILLVPQDLQSDPSLFRRDQSDSDGTFTLAAVPPGRYTVVAIEDGWDQEWAKPSILKQWLSGGEAVQVAPNGRCTIKIKVR